MKMNTAVFVINLIQDINILRPVILLAAKKIRWPVIILVTENFNRKDKEKLWLGELKEIYKLTGSSIYFYSSKLTALSILRKRQGLVFSASESSLRAHSNVYSLFEILPYNFIKITIQHGYECPGLLNSKEHDSIHGHDIHFNADLLCTWQPLEELKTLHVDYHSRVFHTGSTFLLNNHYSLKTLSKNQSGLICENLHSPRVSANSGYSEEFISLFNNICESFSCKHRLLLRPHPSGTFTKNNSSKFSGKYELLTSPIYKLDLSSLLYAVSPPSSIIIELISANVPVAILADKKNNMDLNNYRGLPIVKTFNDVTRFITSAIDSRDIFIKDQKKFLNEKKFEQDPSKILTNFELLFKSVNHESIFSNYMTPRKTILFVSQKSSATLNIHFLKPLSSVRLKKMFNIKIMFDLEISNLNKKNTLNDTLINISPNLIVFVRDTCENSLSVALWAKYYSIPTIYFIDDDLLNYPTFLESEKYSYYTSPAIIKVLINFLNTVSLVYCSTDRIRSSLVSKEIKTCCHVAKIYCSGEIFCVPNVNNDNNIKIGYMGTNHQNDFKLIIPALVELLQKNKNVIFEIMGKTPMPNELLKFSSQVKVIPWIDSYSIFREKLASLKWDIGLCPLEINSFNLSKADTKWVEYTSCGIAVIASRGTVYDNCAKGNCAILAESNREWLEALEHLTYNDNARRELAENAQKKMLSDYSMSVLEEQLLMLFSKTEALNRHLGSENCHD